MEHVKVLVASEDTLISEPLINYFSEWGMETLNFIKLPEISIIKKMSPQLIFMEKNIYEQYCSELERANDQFEKAVKPGIVIVVKPTEKIPLINNVGQNCILKMPYSPSYLFNMVRQALCTNSIELSLGAVLAKLDIIYGILTQEFHSANQSMINEALEYKPEEVFSLEKKLLLDNKCGIIPKSKTLIYSLLKEAENSYELAPYRDQLNLLKQYITALEQEHLSHVDDPDLDPLLISDLLKTHALSRKEVKVFSMITKDMTTEEIADKLFISPETVKSHRRNIRKKLSLVGNKASLGEFIHHLHDDNDIVSIQNGMFKKPKLAC
jgi:DNA-binding CsgD family transcriptional regulator